MTIISMRTAGIIRGRPRVRTITLGIMGALLASALSGCCCCGGCAYSPIPYSEGNPYQCGSGCFWGVGYYMQKYGFLHRPCYDPCDNCDGGWTTAPIIPRNEIPVVPREETKLPMPVPPVTPYDSHPPAPQVPPAPESDDAAPEAPAPDETNE